MKWCMKYIPLNVTLFTDCVLFRWLYFYEIDSKNKIASLTAPKRFLRLPVWIDQVNMIMGTLCTNFDILIRPHGYDNNEGKRHKW